MEMNFGMIGMGVMGSNFALNMADHGYRAVIYNRSIEKSRETASKSSENLLEVADSLSDFVSKIQRPRTILLFVNAGHATCSVVDQLLPLLSAGDTIADCGNSHFEQSNQLSEALREKGLYFLGIGVSGGEEGARYGPSIMPGGDFPAYERISEMLRDVAAKAEDGVPCCHYISTGGAGHFVKMVHNGIEYADMQIIAEAYQFLRDGLKFDNLRIAAVFEQFNKGELNSYLVEVAIKVLCEGDDIGQGYLLDKILPEAQQKGTGRWMNSESVKLGVDTSILLAGLNARILSDLREERMSLSSRYERAASECQYPDTEKVLAELEKALLAARIMAYAQGFTLMYRAQESYGWQFDFREIASLFRAGCIIRSKLLQRIMRAYEDNPQTSNFLLSNHISDLLQQSVQGLRDFALLAVKAALPISAMLAALSFFDTVTAKESSANIIQAMRDYFGAHSYHRIDMEGFFHHEWGK